MTNQGSFQLDCIDCKAPVVFSLADLDTQPAFVCCTSCNKKYGLGEDPLKRQLKKFAALCKQIQDSQEILGDASVVVEVGSQSVQVPFKLLLSRLKSTLNLQVGKTRLCITFRVEPTAPQKG